MLSRAGLAVTSIILLIIVASSCRQERKFDLSSWCDSSSIEDNTRDDMLKDILAHHIIKGKHFNDIGYLLCGEWTFSYMDSIEPGVVINIVKEYRGIDPSYTKDLYVYLDKDSIIEKIRVYEDSKK